MIAPRRRPWSAAARAVTALAFLSGLAFCALALPASRARAAESAAEEASERAARRTDVADEPEGEEGPPSIDGKKLALQIFNFGVLVFVLVKFGGGAINKALGARHEQLKADLASAAELRAQAEAKLAKQEARLASLEHEIAALRTSIKAEAEAEKARLIAAAEERATRIKAETAFLIEQQVREAEQKLRRESADAALKTAEEILRRSIGAADERRFLDTFVSDVEHALATPAMSAGGAASASASSSSQAPAGRPA